MKKTKQQSGVFLTKSVKLEPPSDRIYIKAKADGSVGILPSKNIIAQMGALVKKHDFVDISNLQELFCLILKLQQYLFFKIVLHMWGGRVGYINGD